MSLDKQIKWARRVAVFFGVSGFLPLGYGIYQHVASPYLFELTDLGTFVGGISGPLWSLGALAALYLGFLGQRKDIRLQEKTFERQRFEDNLYRLLEIYEEEVERLRTEASDGDTNRITAEIESVIEKEALELKAEKYFDHEYYYVDNGAVIDQSGQDVNKLYKTGEVRECTLDKDERRQVVHTVLHSILDQQSSKIDPLLSAHMLIVELIDEARKEGIDITKHLILVDGKTRKSEKRLLYWLTYDIEDNYYSELVDTYGVLRNIEEPDDFTSLDEALV
jgi:hypothetical protein